MKWIWFWSFVFLITTSCQTTPEPPLIQMEMAQATPIEAPPVPATISESKPAPSRKKMALDVRRPRQSLQRQEAAPVFNNTITNCPAGMNGSLVGAIEKGRHCFTNEPVEAGRCLEKTDEMVQQKADSYCQNLKTHWKKVGLWLYGPELDLKTETIKKQACKCGSFQGKSLCKTYFEFECETIKTQ